MIARQRLDGRCGTPCAGFNRACEGVQGWLRIQPWLAMGLIFLIHGGALLLYELVFLNVEDRDARDMLAVSSKSPCTGPTPATTRVQRTISGFGSKKRVQQTVHSTQHATLHASQHCGILVFLHVLLLTVRSVKAA